MSTKAQELFTSLGPPMDATNEREIGWRKLRSGTTAWLVDFAAVPGHEQPVVDLSPRCPRCGERMVERTGKYGSFWGCENYPDCKGTR